MPSPVLPLPQHAPHHVTTPPETLNPFCHLNFANSQGHNKSQPTQNPRNMNNSIPSTQPTYPTSMDPCDAKFTTTLNKIGVSLDTLANTQVAQAKDKQKIINNVQQMLLNVATKDSVNPAKKLTNTVKEIMKSSAENVSISLNILSTDTVYQPLPALDSYVGPTKASGPLNQEPQITAAS